MNKNILWGAIVVLIFAIVGFSFSNKEEEVKSNEPIKIGFIGPLTGDAANYGADLKNAIQLASDEINSKGGINGRQINMIYEDGKCNGKDASTAAQKLVNIDNVKFIIGGLCSSEVLATIPIVKDKNVLIVSPSASSPDLTGVSQYFFRNAPSDAVAGDVLAKATIKKYNNVAVISENDIYAQTLKDVFVKTFLKLDGKILYNESYSTNIKDFRSMIVKIKEAKPSALFINPSANDTGAAIIFKQAKEIGLTDVQIYMNILPGSSGFIDKVGKSSEGIIFTDSPALSNENKKVTSFLSAFKTKYNKAPDYVFYTGGAYDDVYILKQAIEKVGTDATDVADYLHSLKDFSGVIGEKYGFDNNGDLVGIDYVLKVIKDGKAIPVQ